MAVTPTTPVRPAACEPLTILQGHPDHRHHALGGQGEEGNEGGGEEGRRRSLAGGDDGTSITDTATVTGGFQPVRRGHLRLVRAGEPAAPGPRC